MKKLRIFMCVLLGHRSLVLTSAVTKSGDRKYLGFIKECERCGTVKSESRELTIE